MNQTQYQKATQRAESNGLISIESTDALTCRDCGHSTREAFVVGPCPKCGSARTATTPGVKREAATR